MTVMFEMKKKNESKRKHRVREFFHKQEEKRPFNNLTKIKLANREPFWLRFDSSVFQNSSILDICRDKIAGKYATHCQFRIKPVKVQISLVRAGKNNFYL